MSQTVLTNRITQIHSDRFKVANDFNMILIFDPTSLTVSSFDVSFRFDLYATLIWLRAEILYGRVMFIRRRWGGDILFEA